MCTSCFVCVFVFFTYSIHTAPPPVNCQSTTNNITTSSSPGDDQGVIIGSVVVGVVLTGLLIATLIVVIVILAKYGYCVGLIEWLLKCKRTGEFERSDDSSAHGMCKCVYIIIISTW